METREIADALFNIVQGGGHARHYTIEQMVDAELDRHEFVRAYNVPQTMPTFDDVCKMTLSFAKVYAKYGVVHMSTPSSLNRMFNQVLRVLYDLGHKDVNNGFLQTQWNRMATNLLPSLRFRHPELWKELEGVDRVRG